MKNKKILKLTSILLGSSLLIGSTSVIVSSCTNNTTNNNVENDTENNEPSTPEEIEKIENVFKIDDFKTEVQNFNSFNKIKQIVDNQNKSELIGWASEYLITSHVKIEDCTIQYDTDNKTNFLTLNLILKFKYEKETTLPKEIKLECPTKVQIFELDRNKISNELDKLITTSSNGSELLKNSFYNKDQIADTLIKMNVGFIDKSMFKELNAKFNNQEISIFFNNKTRSNLVSGKLEISFSLNDNYAFYEMNDSKQIIYNSTIDKPISSTKNINMQPEFDSSFNKGFYILDNENKIIGLTKLGKQQSNLIIPSNVKSIANLGAILTDEEKSKIKSIDLSHAINLEDIEEGGFSGFTELQGKLDFSKTKLNLLGQSVFKDSNKISEIIFPANSNITFEKSLFENCISLESIKFGTNRQSNDFSSQAWTIIQPSVFANTSIENVKLPNSVNAISEYAFSGNEKLTFVGNIFSNIALIGDYAFANTKLDNITINSNLQIGKKPFENSKITQVNLILNGDFNVNSNLLAKLSNLTSLKITSRVSETNPIPTLTFDERAFYDCVELTSLSIENLNADVIINRSSFNNTKIANFDFSTIKGTLTLNESFHTNKSIETFKFNDNLVGIGNYSFFLSTIKNIEYIKSNNTLNNNNEFVIGKLAFGNVELLEKLDFSNWPFQNIKILSNAFSRSKIKEIIFSESAKTTESLILNNCNELNVLDLSKLTDVSKFNSKTFSNIFFSLNGTITKKLKVIVKDGAMQTQIESKFGTPKPDYLEFEIKSN